jgi:hypothetical protein
MVPDFLHEAPPTDAYAAFIKESRMEFANARKRNRKSGCTPHGKPGQVGRTWLPEHGHVAFPQIAFRGALGSR